MVTIETKETVEPVMPRDMQAIQSAELKCRGHLVKYAVIPGSSWGTMPAELQRYIFLAIKVILALNAI